MPKAKQKTKFGDDDDFDLSIRGAFKMFVGGYATILKRMQSCDHNFRGSQTSKHPGTCLGHVTILA